MGPGPAAFRMGRTPAAEDRWAERMPMFCATIAAREGPAARAACLAALGPPAAAQVSLAPRP
jgi:hypothetical protein